MSDVEVLGVYEYEVPEEQQSDWTPDSVIEVKLLEDKGDGRWLANTVDAKTEYLPKDSVIEEANLILD